MLMAEISMWPMDKGQSVSPHVARVLDIIDHSGLAYRLGPLGTTVEGEVDEVMRLVRECHAALEQDCDRIACTIKMDWRRGEQSRIEAKVKSVEEKLGRKLRT
jgi:uncharacterized protein (TIGR00106 family)